MGQLAERRASSGRPQTELQNLALDVGLNSAQFSMTRVINIFERADQVDDTFKVSAADKRVVTGETAKGGDHGLELHEFFECVVMLAFERANPKFGSVGHNTAESVGSPLPGCLETLLKKHLLTRAKTDTLAKVRKMVEKEAAVQMALKPRRAELQKHFETAAKSDSTVTAGSALSVSMERFCQDLFDRNVTKDIMVDPTPIVKGTPLPQRHSR